jgi:AraC-like DNA-binding protein
MRIRESVGCPPNRVVEVLFNRRWRNCYNLTMDVENLPTLRPRDFGSHVDPDRPVLSFGWSAQGPHRVAGHTHPRAQIIYQLSGVYRVATSMGNWVVPSKQAIWIPSHVHHETFTNDTASALMLFIDESRVGALPQACMVVTVSPLLREVLLRVVAYGNDYAVQGMEARLVDVMLDELNAMQPAPLHLPLAQDKRLRRIMDLLLANPADGRGLEELARRCGASGRTLARLFAKQTGMSFAVWRRQLRLLEAVDRLGQGQAVTKVGIDLGYRSSSAFIAMFHRALGVSPGCYALAATSAHSAGRRTLAESGEGERSRAERAR